MNKNCRKITKFLLNSVLVMGIVFSSLAGTISVSAEGDEAPPAENTGTVGTAENPSLPKSPVYVNFNPQETPYIYGTPTLVDNSKLTIEDGRVTALAADELSRLFNEASKHNTPITLDLSNENITEIAPEVFQIAPIHIVKFPASLTKIGARAFQFGLIHQIYFKSEPSTIEIGEDAFTQAGTTISNGVKINAQAIQTQSGTQLLPIGQDFVFYGMVRDPKSPNGIGKQENPYFIDVNGTRTYATLSSDDVEVFDLSEGGGTEANSSTVNLYPTAYTPFTTGKMRISQEKPVKYNLTFNSKNGQVTALKGENFIAYNRVSYLDVTPLFEDGEYKLTYRPVGESTGIDANILTSALQEAGYVVVGLNQLYPHLTEEQIRGFVKDIQEGNGLPENVANPFAYDTNYQGSIRLYVNHINKKYHDIVFVAKPVVVTYAYYDQETGEQISVEEVNTFEGIQMPPFSAPEGYTPVVENFKILPKVRGSETFMIPIKKNSDGTVTSSISFINESGFKIGPTFYLAGKEGSAIDLQADKAIKDFIDTYKVKLVEEFVGTFENNKNYVIIVKGKLSDLRGPQGEKGEDGKMGPQGPRGPRGIPGAAGVYGSTKESASEIVNKIIKDNSALNNLTKEITKDISEKIEKIIKELKEKSSRDDKQVNKGGEDNKLGTTGEGYECCHLYNILGIKFRWCCRWNFYWLLILTISYIVGLYLRRRKHKEYEERLEELEKINEINVKSQIKQK